MIEDTPMIEDEAAFYDALDDAIRLDALTSTKQWPPYLKLNEVEDKLLTVEIWMESPIQDFYNFLTNTILDIAQQLKQRESELSRQLSEKNKVSYNGFEITLPKRPSKLNKLRGGECHFLLIGSRVVMKEYQDEQHYTMGVMRESLLEITIRPINNKLEIYPKYHPAIEPLFRHIQGKIAIAYPQSEVIPNFDDSPRQTPQPTGKDANVMKQTEKAKRKRGISPDILINCKDGMKEWLDVGIALKTAADKAGITKETLQKWIPAVLNDVDEETRTRWINKLKVLGKKDYLGEFSEV